MIRKILPVLFLILSLGLYGNVFSSESNFDHEYKKYDLLLSAHVSNGKVDYAGLKKNSADLDLIIAGLTGVTQEQYDSWNSSRQLAYLINLYNAVTLELILDNYPLAGIKDIGNPWDKDVVTLYGNKISLNQLEHEVVRKNFKEPRIHFALVCAAKGCPSLLSEAYTGNKLESQLDGAAGSFLAIPEKNKIDDENQVIEVSPIFDWFADDFIGKSGSVIEFIAPYYSKKPEDLKFYQIKYTYYDWSLNDK